MPAPSSSIVRISPVLLADDPEALDQGLDLDGAVGYLAPLASRTSLSKGVHVQGAEEDVPEQVLGRGEAVAADRAARDEPVDVVGLDVPLAPQDLRHLGVLDPAPAQVLSRWARRGG